MDKSISTAGDDSMADGIHILSTDVMINIIETRMPRVGRALTLVLSLTIALATWLAALTAIAFCGGKVLRNLVIPSIVWVHDLIIEIGSGWPAWPSVQGVHLPNRYLRGLLLVESLSETLYRVTRYVFGMIDVLWCGMLHDFDHHIHTWKTFQA